MSLSQLYFHKKWEEEGQCPALSTGLIFCSYLKDGEILIPNQPRTVKEAYVCMLISIYGEGVLLNTRDAWSHPKGVYTGQLVTGPFVVYGPHTPFRYLAG